MRRGSEGEGKLAGARDDGRKERPREEPVKTTRIKPTERGATILGTDERNYQKSRRWRTGLTNLAP